MNWHSYRGPAGWGELCESCGLPDPAEVHHRSRVFPGASDDLTPRESALADQLLAVVKDVRPGAPPPDLGELIRKYMHDEPWAES